MKNKLITIFVFGWSVLAQADPNTPIMALLGTGPCTPLSSSWTPQWSNLTGYWPLDGTVGGVSNGATITATVGTNGTVSGTSGAYATGHIGQGFYANYNTNSTEINVGTGSAYDYGTTSFTVSYWVMIPTGTVNPRWWIGKGNGYNGGFCGGGGGAGTGGWGVGNWTTSSTISPSLYLSDGVTCVTAVTGNIARGVWMHNVVRVDRTANVAAIFVNGQKATASIASLGSMTNTSGGYAPFSIGRGASSFMNATLDEVAIWNVALTDAQIAMLYSQQSCSNN